MLITGWLIAQQCQQPSSRPSLAAFNELFSVAMQRPGRILHQIDRCQPSPQRNADRNSLGKVSIGFVITTPFNPSGFCACFPKPKLPNVAPANLLNRLDPLASAAVERRSRNLSTSDSVYVWLRTSSWCRRLSVEECGTSWVVVVVVGLFLVMAATATSAKGRIISNLSL